MSFKIEENIVKVSKDCNTCEHIKVCKFHSKMKALCETNEFYSMHEYLEWNNSLAAFELNSSCQFFKLNYIIPADNSLDIKIDNKIIDEIVSLNKPKGVHSYNVQIDNNKVEFYIGNKEYINIEITELLYLYKFSDK